MQSPKMTTVPSMATIPSSSDTDDAADDSVWGAVDTAPPDSVFGIVSQYKKDNASEKVDLVVGAYRDEEGRPYLLPSVSAAETAMAAEKLDKEYLPIEGLKAFRDAAAQLVLGEDSPALQDSRVSAVQTLSGTGALRLAADVYRRVLTPRPTVYISDPTWGNHRAIFEAAGFHVQTYRYWDAAEKRLDFQGLLHDVSGIPVGSVLLLHLCAHNPTGVDPTRDQWRQVLAACKKRRLRVLFDSAYQGYCTGDLDEDAWPARHAVEQGLEFGVTMSFSKNMGLYGERVGCLVHVCATPEVASAVLSQCKVVTRASYSNPPVHGARIAARVLTDPKLRAVWVAELKGMSSRISDMRVLLRSRLEACGVPGDWSHITSQRGMFSFTGVGKAVAKRMLEHHHVYLLPTGRISIAGVTTKNVDLVARAMQESIDASR